MRGSVRGREGYAVDVPKLPVEKARNKGENKGADFLDTIVSDSVQVSRKIGASFMAPSYEHRHNSAVQIPKPRKVL